MAVACSKGVVREILAELHIMTDLTLNPQVYANWRASTLGSIIERREIALVFDLAKDLKGKRVLDIGTGDGAYAIEAARRGALVTALDSAPGMLQAAQKRAEAAQVRLSLQEGHAELLPFADGSFDVAIAVTVFCFISAPEQALAEIRRILVPGGRLILADLNSNGLWAIERRIRGWLGNALWRVAHFRSVEKLRSLAIGAGFGVNAICGAIYFPPSAFLAQVMEPLEPLLTAINLPGAAFIAMSAEK